MLMLLLFVSGSLSRWAAAASAASSNESSESASKDVQFSFITGKVFPPEELQKELWQADAKVYLKGATQKGFIREDGTFVFSNVPPGSYIVEVTHPKYAFEQVRVEINFKGKIRARKVNLIQTSVVVQVPYPLKIKAYSPVRYFQMREQWRITDLLFNPMVLMMVLPLLFVMVLPRMMNDPEARKEMEQLGNLTKYDMPEMSEMITSFFGETISQNNNNELSNLRRKTTNRRRRPNTHITNSL